MHGGHIQPSDPQWRLASRGEETRSLLKMRCSLGCKVWRVEICRCGLSGSCLSWPAWGSGWDPRVWLEA